MQKQAKNKPSPNLYIIVPVYNEAANIIRFLRSLRSLKLELEDDYQLKILLVDDGSKDGTADLARENAADLDLTVLSHRENLGPGEAFNSAFRSLAERFNDGDLVITMEGDNTSRIDLINQMLRRLEEDYDVVFASPYMYGGGILHTSFFRVFLSSMANLFIKELLGIHGLLTVSSFFRLYRVPLIKRLQTVFGAGIIERRGFECMTEMVMKMIFIGAKISEVPMVLDTHARTGKSRMKIFRTIRGYFSLWFLKGKWQRAVKLHTNQ